MAELHEPMDGLYADVSAVEPLAEALALSGHPLLLRRVPAQSPLIDAITRAYRRRGVVMTRPAAGSPWIFHQRQYDHETLRWRLLRAADLETLDASFFGEASVPVERLLLDRRMPKVLRWALFPLHFPLSRMFLRPLAEDQPSKKKVAALTLRKPLTPRCSNPPGPFPSVA